jgi:hypothetical protein
MIIQYIYSYPPFLEDDSFSHNLRMHRATGDNDEAPHCMTRKLLFFLLAIYYSSDKIKKIRWMRHVACIGEEINGVGASTYAKRPLPERGRRPRTVARET